MVRAWKAADRLQDRAALKAWLYRIASNVCFDMLGGAQRRAQPMDLGPASAADASLGAPMGEHAWVQPIDDGRVLPDEADPAEVADQRESLKLAFVAALQHLPPKQRSVLVLREVLRWQASEVAELLDTSVASVNSALQRARATLESLDLDLDSTGPSKVDDAEQQELLTKYVEAFEAFDVSELVKLLHQDAAFSMPPFPLWITGPDSVRDFMHGTGAKCEGSKVIPLAVNGGAGIAIYNPKDDGWDPWAIVVLEMSDGRITGLHHFIFPELFAEFGLPPRLEREHVA
jgi:RNA polymerase sigma-70 factor (ECF subfamily)